MPNSATDDTTIAVEGEQLLPSRPEIRILGPTELWLEGQMVPMPSLGERAVLAALALRMGTYASVETLASDIWGDDLPQKWRKNIHVRVSRLRSRLNEHRSGFGDELVVSTAEGYRLGIDTVEVDLYRFESLLGSGRSHLTRGDSTVAAEQLSAALDLWRGDPIPELADSSHGHAESARIVELYHAAVDGWNEAAIAEGDYESVVYELEAVLRRDPLRERRWGQLMLAQYRLGRQGDALRTYQRARSILDEELGIQPSPELQRLEGQILAQSPELDPGPVEHRGSAVARAAWASGPRDGSVASTEGPSAAENAWIQRHRTRKLVGRQTELDRLLSIWGHVVAESVGAAVVLTGDAGIGKSRLVAELATSAEADDAMVLRLRCVPGGGLIGLEQVGELLGMEPPESLTRWDSPEVVAFALEAKHAFQGLLDSRPGLVVLEDAHWMNAELIAILRQLSDEPVPWADPKQMMGVIVRRNGVPLQRDWAGMETDIGRVLRARMDLGPLSELESAELLRDATAPVELDDALVARVLECTNGNPGYLMQFSQAIAATGDARGALGPDGTAIPDSLQAAVRERLEGLSPSVARVLLSASVVGVGFDLDDVAQAAAVDEEMALDAVEAAMALRLVEEEPDGSAEYSFVTPVERTVLLQELSSRRRERIERRLGASSS